jgi:hypothetical protein
LNVFLSGVNFKDSEIYVEFEKRCRRLTPEFQILLAEKDFSKLNMKEDFKFSTEHKLIMEKEKILNMVIAMEKKEVTAINNEYNLCRAGESFKIYSIDKTERLDFIFDKNTMDFIYNETKLENMIEIAIGQNVSFTSNDVDPNAANNSMGIVSDIKFADGEIVEIVVVPILTNVELVPHPIKVIRKLRQLTYVGNSKYGAVILTRSQFPLRAADGSTVNSVQGVSLSIAHIVNSQRCSNKGYGRIYVSCSRAVHERLVYILFKLRPEDVVACPIALKFDLFHRSSVVSEVLYELYIPDEETCEIYIPSNAVSKLHIPETHNFVHPTQADDKPLSLIEKISSVDF